MSRSRSVFLLSAVAALAANASMTRADYDVSPAVSGGQIVTSAFTDATSDFVPNVRVFDFGFDDPGPPLTTQDPGFHPQAGSGIPAGFAVTVRAVSGLSYWNGTEPIAFGSVPAGETLNLEKGSTEITVGSSAPSGSVTVNGNFPPGGESDDHLQSTLLGVGANVPSDGIYLVQLQLHDSSPSITDSKPFFVLYNNGVDDSVMDDAKEYIRDNFAPDTNLAPLPEPAMLAFVAGSFLIRRRRRWA